MTQPIPDQIIFQTDRLVVRPLTYDDRASFYGIMGDPEVMNPIPYKEMTQEESDAQLDQFVGIQDLSLEKKVWAVDVIGGEKCIGICALIINDENDDEVGYRYRKAFWGNGYATEVAKGLIQFAFEKLQTNKVTGDVYIENIGSVKVLEKFMTPIREFFCEKDGVTDRRYAVTRKEWELNDQNS